MMLIVLFAVSSFATTAAFLTELQWRIDSNVSEVFVVNNINSHTKEKLARSSSHLQNHQNRAAGPAVLSATGGSTFPAFNGTPQTIGWQFMVRA